MRALEIVGSVNVVSTDLISENGLVLQ